jgi:L-rhamnose mutarotase
MKRIGFILKVKQDMIPEYKRHHQNVWQEMKDALHASGWLNYSLFMREDGLLFGYFETPLSFDAARAAMSKTEVNERWQTFMAPYFEFAPGGLPDQMMVELEEVFHID